MLLGCLEFHDNRYGRPICDGFCEIVRGFGHDVELLSHDGSAKGLWSAYNRARELIRDASSLFVPNSTAIFGFAGEDEPTLASLIRDRVSQGCRLFVQPWINDVEKWNGFLAPYDLCATSTRICKRQGNSLDCEATTRLTIRRSAHSFRDPSLFQGVEHVILEQPVAIWYGGDSLPVLLATEDALPIDAERDLLPVPDKPWAEGDALPDAWNARELACMAVWYGENGGAVMASIGPALYDPLLKENRRFAENIIKWLTGGERPLSPEDRCHRIEVNLVDFVLGVIGRTGDDWWTERIPLNIRQKCAQRHEEESCRFPKQAYLDLIDLKTIMTKEWGLFEPHLRAAGCERGKEKALAWLDRLNEIRRLIGHPLKKHVAGYAFSADERALLERCDKLVRTLVRATN
jgi:hypothetical protein